MKPVCSVRRIGGVHIVSMHESGLEFAYGENCYEPSVQKKPIVYPGKGYHDKAYKEFVMKRRTEIKQSVQKIRPMSNLAPHVKRFVDSIFDINEQTKHIHNFKPVQNAVKLKR
jgi:hypothetical protein